MKFFRIYRRLIAYPAAALLLLLSMPLGTAQAGMVSTEQVIEQSYPNTSVAEESARDRVMTFMKRQDVREEMRKLGVDPDEALARAGALSNAEIQQLAGRIDELPAGGSTLGIVVGALVLVFVVLLITDLLCFTKVFPFTKCVGK